MCPRRPGGRRHGTQHQGRPAQAAPAHRRRRPRRRPRRLPPREPALRGPRPARHAGDALAREGFAVLPQLLAIALVSSNWQVEYTAWDREQDEAVPGCAFGWRRTASRSNGAEMVSWPPHVYVSKNGTRYPWSYTLRLSAQTLPFDPSPRIHVHAASADGHAVPSSTPNAPSGYICYRLPPGPITPHPSGSPVSSGTKAGAARAAIWAGMTTWPRPCPADHPGPPARPPRPCP